MASNLDHVDPVGVGSSANAEKPFVGRHDERRVLIERKSCPPTVLESHGHRRFENGGGGHFAESLHMTTRCNDRLWHETPTQSPAESPEQRQEVQIMHMGGGVVQRGWTGGWNVDGGHQHGIQ